MIIVVLLVLFAVAVSFSNITSRSVNIAGNVFTTVNETFGHWSEPGYQINTEELIRQMNHTKDVLEKMFEMNTTCLKTDISPFTPVQRRNHEIIIDGVVDGQIRVPALRMPYPTEKEMCVIPILFESNQDLDKATIGQPIPLTNEWNARVLNPNNQIRQTVAYNDLTFMFIHKDQLCMPQVVIQEYKTYWGLTTNQRNIPIDIDKMQSTVRNELWAKEFIDAECLQTT